MNVWYAIPTANPPHAAEHLAAWRDMGYHVALLIDGGVRSVQLEADLILWRADWPGYPRACNQLFRAVLGGDRSGPIIVAGGDDMLPDPHRQAEDIAGEMLDHFPDNLGIMQPTGDAWQTRDERGRLGPAAERICGSAWMTYRFVLEFYGGSGPFWPAYRHYYFDEELKIVTERLGILWQRPDLKQEHHHWQRPGQYRRQRPGYLPDRQIWGTDKEIFEARKAQDFPGAAIDDSWGPVKRN